MGAGDKMDAVLEELPKVHKDAGYVPLVTPTSQIVGTQAVFNVIQGRYNVWVSSCWESTEFTCYKVSEVSSHHLITTLDYVEYSLCTNNL